MCRAEPASQPIIEQHRVRVDRSWVSYEAAGAGQPVVLIHGLGGSARWLAPTIPDLARQLRVYAVDLAHFGTTKSDHPFGPGRGATFLIRWMDRIGLERASVVGYSMGGVIAADLAAEYPDRIDRLVLVDATLFPRGYRMLRAARGLLRTVAGLAPRLLFILLEGIYQAGPLTVVNAALDLLITDVRGKLGQIRPPTLVIWGDDDAILPVAEGRQLSRLIPGAELVVQHGADHNPMWRRPADFNRIVSAFLTASSGAATASGRNG